LFSKLSTKYRNTILLCIWKLQLPVVACRKLQLPGTTLRRSEWSRTTIRDLWDHTASYGQSCI